MLSISNNIERLGFMTNANTEIKSRAKQRGVFMYELAEKIGMVDTAFSRKLRRELPAAEKARIFSLIDEIAAEKKNAAQNVAAL